MISRFGAELVTAGIAAALGLVTTFGSLEFGIGWSVAGPEPGTFPFYIGMLVTAASVGIMIQTLIQRGRLGESFLTSAQFRSVVAFSLPIVGLVMLSLWLGLYVGMAIYLFASMKFQGGYRWSSSALVGIGMAVFMYLILEIGFQTPLLKGPLEDALGL